ncbi:DUF3006 family protein [Natronosalvus caseinilyticus]|uniref:DUF3006 family protein n=1 Tax=Natronosalvus caseinilyticus TaxID=2953747 RepID=UPI0028AA7D1E|nr:DUF3006 family protein [Natronosalvus caseinilyticus]
MTTSTVTAVLDRIVDDSAAVVLLETAIDGEDDEAGNDEANENSSGKEDEIDSGETGDGEADEADTEDPVERQQLELDLESLPEDGRHEGAVFEVVLEDGAVREMRYRPDEEADRRDRLQDRFNRLSDRLPDRD